MNIRFMVPWRPEPEFRDRLWAFARAYWWGACPDIAVVEGPSPDGPFNRSAAINAAARGDWDVGIVLDADVFAPPLHVYAAIDRARDTERVVLPYTEFQGLTPRATARTLEGVREPFDARSFRFLSSVHESSIVVIPRAVWDEVGGFDERFVGWGQEDVAFAQSARVLTGPITRVEGPVWHLWHPNGPSRDQSLPSWKENQVLGDRYRETTDPEAMRELLEGRYAVSHF